MPGGALRRVLVLVNPKSGLPKPFIVLRRALDRFWDVPGTDLVYQFAQSTSDGISKVRRAVERGVDTVLVVGGDGTVSTVGRELVGTATALGVLPAGSGNGFARHFNIPLAPDRAAQALASAAVQAIDVGVVDGTRFLVTCSMAWDAQLVRSFERTPVRGILPYVFAGVNEFFQYHPQDIDVVFDDGEALHFDAPMVFTIANLTQFGGGACIAPQARHDDGRLELVVARRQDVPKLVANLGRLFDGSINELPEVISRRFRAMTVRRERAGPIQIDGELVEASAESRIRVQPSALRVLVPG